MREGFTEHNLEFLEPGWGLRRLRVLDRSITNLAPIGRLGDSLEDLSVQAAPPAELDLGLVPQLRAVGGEWALISATLNELDELWNVVTWRFDEVDLHAFRDHVNLRRLTIKEAPLLESLDGIDSLPGLEVLSIIVAPRLRDISDAADLGATLQEFELQGCGSLSAIDDVASLVNLRFLRVSDCGNIESLAPIKELQNLEVLYAWGSTRVVNGDLSPLARLSHLREIRMQDRREYRPRVADLVSSFSSSGVGFCPP